MMGTVTEQHEITADDRSETVIPDAEADALAERIERQIDELLRLGRKRVRERAASVHPRLHPQGFTVLAAIGRTESILQSELGEVVGLDRTSLSKVVTSLQELGLISQAQSQTDRRARVLQATPEGRTKILEALRERRSAVWAHVKDWPRHEAETFADLLTQYNAVRTQTSP